LICFLYICPFTHLFIYITEKEKKDDEPSDDETDDEMGTSQTTYKQAAGGGGGAKYKTKFIRHRIQKGETFILSTLSLPDEEKDENPTVSATMSSALPTVRLGLGPPSPGEKLPSGESPLPAATLEVTRIPLNLCVTRV
jgi:hypothetical protein